MAIFLLYRYIDCFSGRVGGSGHKATQNEFDNHNNNKIKCDWNTVEDDVDKTKGYAHTTMIALGWVLKTDR